MDKKTFVGLLETQIDSVKSAEIGKSENETILKTVKLLLDRVNYSDEVISGYDQREMRKFFASFGAVAQTACDFYAGAKNNLDPIALQGEIGNKIETAISEIQRVTALLDAIECDYAELLKQENELAAMNAAYSKEMKKIKELQDTYEAVSDKKIETLKQEAEKLNNQIDQNKKEIFALNTTVNERKTVLISLQGTYVRLIEEQRCIEENVIEVIQKRHDELRDIYVKYSGDLERITSEIERFKMLYSNFDANVKKAKETYDTYVLHLGENSDIAQKLRKYDFLSADGIVEEIKRFEKGFKAEFDRFDSLLRDLIAERKKIKDKIEEMQGKR